MDVGTIITLGIVALAMVAMHRMHGHGGGHGGGGHGGGQGGGHGGGGCGGGHDQKRPEEGERSGTGTEAAPAKTPAHEHGKDAPARGHVGH